ncbi:hypothetical protein HPB47_012598, partial [Ixodes persulcatus]
VFQSCVTAQLVLNPPDCGKTEASKRIVNGKAADEGQFPWLVFLKSSFGLVSTRCGASIITKQHLVTAAHCTLLEGKEVDKMTVFYGNTNFKRGTKRRVAMFLRHPEFERKTFKNDICILLLEKPIEYSEKVRPICIPTTPVDIFNKEVTVAGWGYLRPHGKAKDDLRYTSVNVLPNSRCKEKFRTIGYSRKIMYCAYRKDTDACQGDSGGPLMSRFEDGRIFQAGIVSYGIGCAKKDMPGVYARMDALSPWLIKNIANYDEYDTLQ